jgi:hypothetical protein
MNKYLFNIRWMYYPDLTNKNITDLDQLHGAVTCARMKALRAITELRKAQRVGDIYISDGYASVTIEAESLDDAYYKLKSVNARLNEFTYIPEKDGDNE